MGQWGNGWCRRTAPARAQRSLLPRALHAGQDVLGGHWEGRVGADAGGRGDAAEGCGVQVCLGGGQAGWLALQQLQGKSAGSCYLRALKRAPAAPACRAYLQPGGPQAAHRGIKQPRQQGDHRVCVPVQLARAAARGLELEAPDGGHCSGTGPWSWGLLVCSRVVKKAPAAVPPATLAGPAYAHPDLPPSCLQVAEGVAHLYPRQVCVLHNCQLQRAGCRGQGVLTARCTHCRACDSCLQHRLLALYHARAGWHPPASGTLLPLTSLCVRLGAPCCRQAPATRAARHSGSLGRCVRVCACA